jgi:hypothetical protein
MPSKSQKYSAIFFTWCVPGLLLIIFGVMAGQPAFSHFGVALLCLGLIYYGRAKQHPRRWYLLWLTISAVYVVLGAIELVRG